MKRKSSKLTLSRESLQVLDIKTSGIAGGLYLETGGCDETLRCTTSLFESIGCGPYPSYNPCYPGTGQRCY